MANVSKIRRLGNKPRPAGCRADQVKHWYSLAHELERTVDELSMLADMAVEKGEECTGWLLKTLHRDIRDQLHRLAFEVTDKVGEVQIGYDNIQRVVAVHLETDPEGMIDLDQFTLFWPQVIGDMLPEKKQKMACK